jgi:hypothetical protein
MDPSVGIQIHFVGVESLGLICQTGSPNNETFPSVDIRKFIFNKSEQFRLIVVVIPMID